MKDPIKTPEDIKRDLCSITQFEKDRAYLIISSLTDFMKQDRVDLDGFKSLTNIERDLWTLKDNYTTKLINMLRQGNII